MKRLFLLLLLVSCSQEQPLTRRSGIAMTIPYEVMVGSSDHGDLDTLIATTFAEINSRYNNWNTQSEISQLNQTGVATPALAAFLARVALLTHKSEGLFNPNFTPGQIDLCGVAKGYCVDLLTERLINSGYTNCYVSWGGEIRVAGHHPEGRPWRISIASPTGDQAVTVIELTDCAVATSGDYLQRSAHADGTVTTHITDPRTGQPLPVAPGQLTSATILAPTCMEADALATALMVAGPDAPALAAQLESQGHHCWLIAH